MPAPKFTTGPLDTEADMLEEDEEEVRHLETLKP